MANAEKSGPSEQERQALLAVARRAWQAGLSVLPADPASKRPSRIVGRWQDYQATPATAEQWTRWAPATEGLGIVCGLAGVECIDFDMGGIAWTAWAELVEFNRPGLLGRLYLERSPSGGRHALYRCAAPEGNQKLTRWWLPLTVGQDKQTAIRCGQTIDIEIMADAKGRPTAAFQGKRKFYPCTETMEKWHARPEPIETRGSGGWVVVAPSAGYVALQGSLDALPWLRSDERDLLLECARQLSDAEPLSARYKPAAVQQPGSTRPSQPGERHGERPGDRYNREADHRQLLESNGWTYCGEHAGQGGKPNELWTRPGKRTSDGHSATWDRDLRKLYCWTSSAPPLEANQAYSLFRLFSLYEHKGDDSAAAKALRDQYHPNQAARSTVGTAIKGPGEWHDRRLESDRSARALPPPRAIIEDGQEITDDDMPADDLDEEAAAAVDEERSSGSQPPGGGWNGIARYDETDWPELNEHGNALRFLKHYRDRVRYCHTWKTWLTWTGTHWKEDANRQADRWFRQALVADIAEQQRAIGDVPKIYEIKEQLAGLTKGDPARKAALRELRMAKTREQLDKWCVKNQNDRAIRNSLSRAEALEALSVTADELDTEGHLFACKNGVLDLRTGALLPHDPARLMTRACPIEYDSDALDEDRPGAVRWFNFLRQLTGGEESTEHFLKYLAGYSMTGSTEEEVCPMFVGPGGTGKSTFVAALSGILGDYAEAIPFETLLSNNQTRKWTLAKISQARLVSCEEAPEGRAFAADVVKAITGGTPIEAERKFADPFTYRPRFKLWLVSNELPRVSDQDSGFWRRLLLIRCDHQPEKKDKGLKTAMETDIGIRQAVLAWMVQGAVAWHRDGLTVPDSIRASTDGYREEQDPLQAWLEERTAWAEGNACTRKEAFSDYTEWARDNANGKGIGHRAFAERLRARGATEGATYDRDTKRMLRGWQGLRLLRETETKAPEGQEVPPQPGKRREVREVRESVTTKCDVPIACNTDTYGETSHFAQIEPRARTREENFPQQNLFDERRKNQVSEVCEVCEADQVPPEPPDPDQDAADFLNGYPADHEDLDP